MRFDKMMFHKGTNVVLKRTIDDYMVGDVIEIENKNGDFIYDAEVTGSKHFRFCDIPENLFLYGHCFKNREQALKEMRRLFPDFDEKELVYVVSFEIDWDHEWYNLYRSTSWACHGPSSHTKFHGTVENQCYEMFRQSMLAEWKLE
jgi:hypothetical protein